ncbi:MAG TPA: hypothetical protein VGM02_01630 [Acidobacteriaceae bacterium]|jgi:hypothetical protein
MLKLKIVRASEAPPALYTHTNRNDDWDALAEKLQDIQVGDWIEIPLDAFKNKTTYQKRTNVHKAMAARKLTVITRVLGANLYVRCRTDKDPQRNPKKK